MNFGYRIDLNPIFVTLSASEITITTATTATTAATTTTATTAATTTTATTATTTTPITTTATTTTPITTTPSTANTNTLPTLPPYDHNTADAVIKTLSQQWALNRVKYIEAVVHTCECDIQKQKYEQIKEHIKCHLSSAERILRTDIWSTDPSIEEQRIIDEITAAVTNMKQQIKDIEKVLLAMSNMAELARAKRESANIRVMIINSHIEMMKTEKKHREEIADLNEQIIKLEHPVGQK